MTEIDRNTMEKELFALEEAGWEAISSANGDFYRRLVTPETLVVEHDGVATGDDLVAEIDGNESPFENFRLDDRRLVPLSPDSAVVTYRATADVTGRGTFRLYMSSVWVRREEGWKLMFHQQTPASQQEG
ncbi:MULTISPECIES: nuclear transport factor 2 family protein [Streptomyces]|uniref:DUF4440 domain-containing protein n=1 Tax=Streptomyces pini TaxID=1520580 RepID=A0A1I4CQY2_9ACTN|nr:MULTISPECIES: nuclear transport factor 2 family protein [Streptomyces]SFK82689.1 protein of unknown function [Streptomyces pini]